MADWKSLTDGEWVNIVNSDAVKAEGSYVHGAVCAAFKLIEARLREKNEVASPPVAVQEEGDAWQPIETAPKDGKEFLAIWERQGNLMQVVRWNTVHKFYQAKGEPILGFSSNATAWQPLPSPPAAMKGDQP